MVSNSNWKISLSVKGSVWVMNFEKLQWDQEFSEVAKAQIAGSHQFYSDEFMYVLIYKGLSLESEQITKNIWICTRLLSAFTVS